MYLCIFSKLDEEFKKLLLFKNSLKYVEGRWGRSFSIPLTTEASEEEDMQNQETNRRYMSRLTLPDISALPNPKTPEVSIVKCYIGKIRL
jgi:hypothetical protein